MQIQLCGCDFPFIGPSLGETCYNGSFILFMSILDTLIRKKCDLSEICQRVRPKFQPDLEYDFVVIGGGAGGSVVAARLSEVTNWKVLLIEAGNDEPVGLQVPSMMSNFLENPLVDWNYKTEPQSMACLGYPEMRCRWPRGKALGGSGVFHGMMYMRGLPQDYDMWEAMGNNGWNYKEVLKYFKFSEQNKEIFGSYYHGYNGPMKVKRFPSRPELANDVLQAAEELGYSIVDDLNSPPYQGFTIAQANIVNGSRLSSARAYLRPIRHRTNLHIMLNSTATKILLNITNESKKILGVNFIHNNQTFFVRIKRELILAAGTINTPQLLLLSGIGPREVHNKFNIQQIHDLPGVGQNFQNHVSFFVNFRLSKIKAINDLNWLTSSIYLNSRTGPLSSTGMAQLTARLSSKYAENVDYPDLQLFFSGFLADCSRSGIVGEPQDLNNPLSPKNFTIIPVILHPKSRGYIGLKSNNPLSPPLMNPNFLANEEDVNVLIEGIRIAQKLANTKILKEKYGVELIEENYGNCSKQFFYNSDKFWACAIRYSTGPENHQTSSCKMGPSTDPLAVVDPKLQVYGIEGLRIMDASIMPSIISGNTHATVVMIAEKGADFIKKKWLNT